MLHELYKKIFKTQKIGSGTKEVSESESAYIKVQSDAYGDLFSFIRNEMLPDRVIVPVAKLLCRIENFMQVRGFKIRDSDKKHIRRRLESEFGDILHIYKDESGKLIAVPNSVTVEDMVLENRKFKKEVKTLTTKASDIICIIKLESCSIRSCIHENSMSSPWPYHPSNITEESMKVPCLMQQFLTGVLTGEPDNESPSERVKLLVQSFGQDLIYAATRGQQKPPKHFLLPYAIKTLTCNVELIHMVNKLGHGISYSQLEENDTALCLQKLAATKNRQVVIHTYLSLFS